MVSAASRCFLIWFVSSGWIIRPLLRSLGGADGLDVGCGDGGGLGLAARCEAEGAPEQGKAAEGETGEGADVGDLGDLPPAVGVEQHAAQGLALEDGGDQAGQLGVAGLCDGLGG